MMNINKKNNTEKKNKIFKIFKIVLKSTVLLTLLTVFPITAFATNAGEAQFNNVINFFATWIQRAGGVIAFIGAVMFGFAWKNDDADGKQRGLMTIISGFIVFAVASAPSLFGIVS